jgi:ubiquitin carboxyl-terminal hydrolase 9/24
MGILQRLFCGCHRALRFYQYFDQNQEDFKEPVTKVFKGADFLQRRTPTDHDVDIDGLKERIAARADDLVFGHALNFLNYFAELGGFAALLALLRAGNLRPEEPVDDAEGSKVQKELMPLDLLSELTGAFSNCRALLSESFAKRFVQEVQEIVNARLMGMRNKEIKELDKDGLPAVFQSYRSFLQLAKSEDEIAELVEQIQLSFASRFLKTTYLEKRLKGVSDIRQLIERVEARATLEKQRQKAAELGT